MSNNTWWGKTLRFIGILFMGITALFTIAAGLGTTCVALNPTGFGESMAKLASFQWLYIIFVIVTTAIGIMAARAVFLLAKSRPNSYRYTVIAPSVGNRGWCDSHAGFTQLARQVHARRWGGIHDRVDFGYFPVVSYPENLAKRGLYQWYPK